MAPGSSLTTSLLCAAVVRSTVAQNARMAPRYARQASGHGAATADAVQYPAEGFSGPFWRNSMLALLFSFAVYNVSAVYTPAAQGADLSTEHSPDAPAVEAKDEEKPFLTRYLAYHMPREGIWKERNDAHLEMTVKQAEDRHLVGDAQRPKIRRLRYPGTFEQASPHGLQVGGGGDLSDLNVKHDAKASAAQEDAEDQ